MNTALRFSLQIFNNELVFIHNTLSFGLSHSVTCSAGTAVKLSRFSKCTKACVIFLCGCLLMQDVWTHACPLIGAWVGASNSFSMGDEHQTWGTEGLTAVQGKKMAELYANERQECQTTVNHWGEGKPSWWRLSWAFQNLVLNALEFLVDWIWIRSNQNLNLKG